MRNIFISILYIYVCSYSRQKMALMSASKKLIFIQDEDNVNFVHVTGGVLITWCEAGERPKRQ